MKFLLLLLMCLPLITQASPVGMWNVIETNTQTIKSVIFIAAAEAEGEVMSGKVVSLYSLESDDKFPFCTKCQGELHNRPVVGMQVIKELRLLDGAWKHGKILNPDNGAWYNIGIELSEDNDRLTLKNSFWADLFGGYQGSKILGEAMTFQRVK
jgi:hypothetical protein